MAANRAWAESVKVSCMVLPVADGLWTLLTGSALVIVAHLFRGMHCYV